MDVEHDLVMVDEFDALSIELKIPKKEQLLKPEPAPAESKVAAELRERQRRYQAWLHQDLGKFPAKAHARKVARELGVQTGLIYLPGQQQQLYEFSDMGPEFRQRRHFYYMAGANFPGCAVTYNISNDSLILWIPYTDPKTVLWYGKTPTPEESKAASDVDEVRYISGLFEFLCANLFPGMTLYILHPGQTPRFENPGSLVRIDSKSLGPAIERARVIKTDYEIAMIRRANAVSSAAHKAALVRLRRFSNEREIDATYRGFCLAQGAKRQAYPPIVASGTSASTLHYDDNDQPLAGRQLVVLDAGAEWNCYASDITRTFPISGHFSPEAAAIHDIVQRMQDECIRRVRPGVLFSALHLRACVVAINELLKLGILRGGTPSDILRQGTIAAFFPHGLGHHVGLEVHDVSGREKLLVQSSSLPSLQPPSRGMLGLVDSLSGVARRQSKREWVGPETVHLMFREACARVATAAAAASQAASGKPVMVSGGGTQALAKNMVVTIEPGIYFCREYIEAYFLCKPEHARYIDDKVLEKYWDVGGVRIEDDILVTENGYENLTLAPKGEEMLKLINAGGGGC
ncbi:hypothetical protein VTK26DRAFT_1371 [Humicola hyalothermophila]